MAADIKRDWFTAVQRRAGRTYSALTSGLSRLEPVALLAMRLLVARVFLLSGLTKWDGLRIRQDAYDLFRYEYFERYSMPDGLVVILATLAALAEVGLPILLAIGFLGRIASAGLLTMALVIQLFVYPEEWWTIHAWWIAVLFLLTSRGPGALSIDWLMGLDRRQDV
jgi:putative oxidoreductase